MQDAVAQFDFIYYEDVLSGIVRGAAYIAGRTGGDCDSITLCTGQVVTLLELAQTIVTELGSTSPIHVEPTSVEGRSRVLENDPSHARDVLGFQAQVPLCDGLRRLDA